MEQKEKYTERELEIGYSCDTCHGEKARVYNGNIVHLCEDVLLPIEDTTPSSSAEEDYIGIGGKYATSPKVQLRVASAEHGTDWRDEFDKRFGETALVIDKKMETGSDREGKAFATGLTPHLKLFIENTILQEQRLLVEAIKLSPKTLLEDTENDDTYEDGYEQALHDILSIMASRGLTE